MAKRTSVEIQAVTVDDAVRLALEQLELTENDVDIEILSEEGPDEDSEALVRVTAKGMASQPTPRAETRKESRPRHRGRGGKDWLGGRTAPGDRPSRRGRPPATGPAPDRVDAEQEQAAKQVVQELLQHMGVDADVVAVDNPSAVPLTPDDPPTIFLDVLGRDLGMLIGRRGEHLQQLQYLANTLVNRKLGTFSRVILDIEGYRSRREEALVGLAERVARQVARSGRSVVLEPMPANERRIIHLTLREFPEVSTFSSGEDPARRITVEPARNA